MAQIAVDVTGNTGNCPFCMNRGVPLFKLVAFSVERSHVEDELGFDPFVPCCLQCAGTLQNIIYLQYREDYWRLDLL